MDDYLVIWSRITDQTALKPCEITIFNFEISVVTPDAYTLLFRLDVSFDSTVNQF